MERLKGMRYIGSLQIGSQYESENPMEEVWSQISRFGVAEFVRPRTTQRDSTVDLEALVNYAVVRARQAVEFRAAFRQSTLITSSIALYYSFLNLTRAFLALKHDLMSSRAHGLKFRSGSDLLTSSARLCRGTFTDYLNTFDMDWRNNQQQQISLSDTLSRIIEIYNDYRSVPGQGSLVSPIEVDAFRDGRVFLQFPDDIESFSEIWAKEFPVLSDICSLESDGNVLKVTDNNATGSYESIAKFAKDKLETDLRLRDTSVWYLVREVEPDLVFPRPEYYFIAMFILGNIVRYQPELMLTVSDPNSELSWFLQRFVHVAERFYPQLMLMWLYNQPIYF